MLSVLTPKDETSFFKGGSAQGGNLPDSLELEA